MKPQSALVLMVFLFVASDQARAQQKGADRLAGSEISADEWHTLLEEAKRRSQEFVANAKAGRLPDPPSTTDEDARIADERALADPSLQKGDIVSTSKGFFVFIGRAGDTEVNSFLKLNAGGNLGFR